MYTYLIRKSDDRTVLHFRRRFNFNATNRLVKLFSNISQYKGFHNSICCYNTQSVRSRGSWCEGEYGLIPSSPVPVRVRVRIKTDIILVTFLMFLHMRKTKVQIICASALAYQYLCNCCLDKGQPLLSAYEIAGF